MNARRDYHPPAPQIVDQLLNSSVIAGRLISQEPRRHGTLHSVGGPDGETAYYTGELANGTAKRVDPYVYYQGKRLERDTTAQSAIIYMRPERKHWWQFWRPKPFYLREGNR